MFQTPILLITFNRPNHTKQVLEAIRKLQPKFLYVFQDFARENNGDDIIKCAAVRTVVNELVDWNCKLRAYYSNENLGCGHGPSSAISWFFEHEEQGIILEDDCVPHLDFFPFCETLLNRYKENKSISFIGGTNFQDGKIRESGSYYFSAGNQGTWGWATWKNRWQYFDYYLNDYDNIEFKSNIGAYFSSNLAKNYWRNIFDKVKLNRIQDSCWDYQFYFACWKHKMLAIIPNVNLISNVGFGDDATHTIAESDLLRRNCSDIMPLKYNDNIIQCKKADTYLQKHYIQSYEYGLSGLKRLPYRIIKKMKLKSILQRITPIVLRKLKSKYKQKWLWYRQGKILRKKILEHYSSKSVSEISIEEQEVIGYLSKHPIKLLPYKFVELHKKSDIIVYLDKASGFKYTLLDGKKLYFKKGWSTNKIKEYYNYILIEQNIKSPHCYLINDFVINKNNSIIDAGAAEGIFTLMNIEKISHAVLFEPDPEWVEALNLTFKNYSDKVEVVEKYLGSTINQKSTTIDYYFSKETAIDFIKIDVEGCEMDVLKSANRVLSTSKNTKVAVCTYHKQNDEINIKQYLEIFGFKCEYSRGYIPFYFDKLIEEPYLRRCLIRANK